MKRIALLLAVIAAAALTADARANIVLVEKDQALGGLRNLATEAVADCDPARRGAGTLRALLVGITEYKEYYAKLVGPANEVPLLRQALLQRGFDERNVRALVGSVTHRDLFAAVESLIRESGCGDIVFWHWGGHSYVLNSGGLALFLSDSPTEDPGAGKQTFTDEAFRYATIALRNRGASVFLSVDSNSSGKLRLAEADDPTWRWSPGGETEPPLLRPGAGAFTGFYASQGEGALELELPPGEPQRKVYGAFTYTLATTLGNGAEITARKLAEIVYDSYRTYFRGQDRILATPAFESTHPDEPVLQPAGRRARATGSGYRIELLQPEPTRGLARIETPRLKVEGRVVPAHGLVAAFVNSSPARLAKDGHFAAEIELQPGRNRVFLNAMVGKDRFVSESFEITQEAAAAGPRGRRYALLIANWEYQDRRWSRLETPQSDVRAVAALLAARYGFVTEAQLAGGQKLPLVLRNASRRDVLSRLSRLRELLTEEDTLLVYYAGHGFQVKEIDKAYWIPVEGEAEDDSTWISSSDVSDQIRRMNARHILVVADSCYSGGLFRGGPEEKALPPDAAARERLLATLGQRRSRVLIASGSNEPVTDAGGGGHSVFARAFLNALGRVPADGASMQDLFAREMRDFVLVNSKQSPQYRPIANAGHDGGDLVFRPLPEGARRP